MIAKRVFINPVKKAIHQHLMAIADIKENLEQYMTTDHTSKYKYKKGKMILNNLLHRTSIITLKSSHKSNNMIIFHM